MVKIPNQAVLAAVFPLSCSVEHWTPAGSFPNPSAVMESNLPQPLQTCGCGDLSWSHRKGRDSLRALSRHCPTSLPPIPASPTHTLQACPLHHVSGSPQIPAAKVFAEHLQNDFPSKSCWLYQDGSGSWLWKKHKGCTRWSGSNHEPSEAQCWLSRIGALGGGIPWIHSQQADTLSQPSLAAPASKICEPPSPTVLFQIKWFPLLFGKCTIFSHLSLTYKTNIPQNPVVTASDNVFSFLVFKHISWLARTF